MGNRDDMPSGVLLTSDPAANTEISITTDYDYKVNLIRIPFVTDANAANRTVTLKITEAALGSVIYEIPISAVITANTTATIMFGEGLPYTDVGDVRMVPLPHGLKLPRGAIIETVTTSIQATDNFGAAVLFVDKLT